MKQKFCSDIQKVVGQKLLSIKTFPEYGDEGFVLFFEDRYVIVDASGWCNDLCNTAKRDIGMLTQKECDERERRRLSYEAKQNETHERKQLARLKEKYEEAKK